MECGVLQDAFYALQDLKFVLKISIIIAWKVEGDSFTTTDDPN